MNQTATVKPKTRARPKTGTSERQATQKILEEASYLVIFSVPDPQSLSVGTPLIPAIPQLNTAIAIVEAPRQFELLPSAPNANCGFRTTKRINKQIADQELRLQVTPNYFESGPDRTPPPTVLLPFLSQRFWMSDGHFSFRDGRNTHFTAEAAGRFFSAGGTSLFLGGVGLVLEGFGALKGLKGNIAINGLTTPPDLFANAFVFRFVDPDGVLQAKSLPPVVPEEPDPDYSHSSLLAFMAEPHPDSEPEIGPGPDGKKSFTFVERLRLAHTNIDVGPGFLKSTLEVLDVVGERRTTLFFDPDSPLEVIPAYSANSKFTFHTGDGVEIGTLEADLKEARLIRTTAAGLRNPYFRITGFGAFGKGTGQFIDVTGILTVNGALSLDPWAASSMYLMRIPDPQNRFQSPWQGGDP